jgi:type I restriction enzyme S subunit
LYLLLRYLYHSDEFLQFENGTTGIKNFAFTVFCDRYDVVVPTLEAQRAFRKLVAPLFAIHSNNGLHTETLAGLRDALLPKLLSGEIRVGEAI